MQGRIYAQLSPSALPSRPDKSHIVTWNLDKSKILPSGPAQPYGNDSDTEICFGKYPRESVRKNDIKPGGKYRGKVLRVIPYEFLTSVGICKLFVYFDGEQDHYESTGFCVVDQATIVTSGHVVFDKAHGRAIAIAAHIGYRGADSHLTQAHEVQMAACVAVHQEWYDNYSKPNDFALIKLRTPFDNVLPLEWKTCPDKEDNRRICVVGYPGDVPPNRHGEYMYESTGDRVFDLEGSDSMLIHRLDTYYGEFACLVIRKLLTDFRQFWLSNFSS